MLEEIDAKQLACRTFRVTARTPQEAIAVIKAILPPPRMNGRDPVSREAHELGYGVFEVCCVYDLSPNVTA